MNTLRDRIAEMKHKRVLRGESVSGPVRATEAAKENKAKDDQFLETRFGDNPKVAGK